MKAVRERNLVTYYYPDSFISKQIQMVCTNIKFLSASAEFENRTMIVTSPGFGEGKSMATVNLGISLAQQGDKVLIIDADLKKPSMDAVFEMEDSIGLTDILSGKCTLEGAVNQSVIRTLDVLTSGPKPANSARLLGSLAMKRLLGTALKTYDVVLIDTPPILEVTDANLLASECDGVIFVAQSGKTKTEKIIEAKRLLELSRAKVIGCILNKKV